MESLYFEPRTTALLLIDLQNGILGLPLAPYTAKPILERSNELMESCRQAGSTVVLVRVLLTELRHPAADRLSRDPSAPPPAAVASELSDDLQRAESDVIVTKRQWGGFYGTDLDLQLRRRGIRTLILGGIATNLGVESTARAAFDRGYDLIFAEDATTSVSAKAHQAAMNGTFPFMGKVRSTEDILEALRA